MRLYSYVLFGCCAFAVTKSHAGEFECLTEPRQIVELKSQVEGQIAKIHVDRGDYVQKGQILVELDVAVDKARLDLARYKSNMESAIQAAAYRTKFADKKLERQNSLFDKKYVSAQDRDEAETGKQLAEAELVEARDNKQLAHLESRQYDEILHQKIIRSPFAGIVMQRTHQPGEVTVGGDDPKPILKLAEIDPLYVEVIVSARVMTSIRIGQEVRVLPDEPGEGEWLAKIKVVDPVVDAASGTVGVRLELPNPQRAIPAGIRCRADFANLPTDRPRVSINDRRQ